MLRRRRNTGAWAGEGLVFVTGHPRSGTTVLGRLLGSHPDVGYWEETGLVRALATMHADLTRLERHAAVDALISGGLRVGNSKVRLEPTDDQSHAADERAVLIARGVLAELVDHFRSMSGRPIVVDKTPGTMADLPIVRALVPDATVVHIIRDPRDVAGSAKARYLMIKSPRRPDWLPPSDDDVITAVARNWLQVIGWGIAAEAAGSRIVRVRYEELAASPESVARGLVDRLGLRWSPRVDEFIRTAMDAGRARAWPERLTDDEVAAVEPVAGEMMRRLGYDPSA